MTILWVGTSQRRCCLRQEEIDVGALRGTLGWWLHTAPNGGRLCLL